MRAVVITKHGPPEAMQVQERPDPPAPGSGEVTVDVAAVGINFAEVLARIGASTRRLPSLPRCWNSTSPARSARSATVSQRSARAIVSLA